MNWRAIFAGLVVGGCLAGAVQQWRLGAQVARGQTELSNANAKHVAELKAISDKAASAAGVALAETVRAASAVAAVEQTYRTEHTNAQKTIDALRADVRAGDVRLRVAAASCATSTGTDRVSGAGAAAGGTDGDGTAELDRTAADALLSITGDGDRAIRKLTALQGYVRAAQRVCGVQ